MIPCKGQTAVTAFDELFKAHYVFWLNYNDMLHGFYTFLQTTVYHIDAETTKETPRMKELRTRLLQRENEVDTELQRENELPTELSG